MATIADLRMRVHMRHAYLLLIEGCPFAFCDERALTGSWWTLDDRRILPGLSVPQGLEISLDLESGLIEENSADFRVLDIDGTVPGFFGGLEKPYKNLGQRVLPGIEPITAPLIGADQDLLAAEEGGYLGTEAIGPNGERGYYSCIPFAQMPGQDHPFFDEPRVVFTTRETGPLIVEGRRVALYRVIFDPDTNTWPDFDTQCQGLIDLDRFPPLWWGTLRQAGKVEGRTWDVSCSGPGSWLRRSLATRMPTTWYPVSADVVFETNEKKVGLFFYKYSVFNSGFTYGADVNSFSIPNGGLDAVVTYLSNAISTVANMMGLDGVWTSNHPVAGSEGSFVFSDNGCTVATLGNTGWAARFDLKLHDKVWRLLGYDTQFNPGSLDGPQPVFTPSGDDDGYYLGTFSTVPAGRDPFGYDGTPDWDGNGIPRQYSGLYGDGVSVISGMGGQVIKLTPENNDEIYVEPQTIRPIPEGEVDGVDTDAYRWWVFKGPIQRPDQEDPEETIQIARCSWVRQSSGLMKINPDGVSRSLYIHGWLDPRLFGFNHKPIEPDVGWASNNGAEDVENQIQASPLSVFGVYYRRPDFVVHTLIRTLISTGTGFWDDTVDVQDSQLADLSTTNLQQGLNSTGLDLPFAAQDCEIYDMSLQYPSEGMDFQSFWMSANDLAGGSSGALGLGKVALQGCVFRTDLNTESGLT